MSLLIYLQISSLSLTINNIFYMKNVKKIAKNWTIIYKGGKILVAKSSCNLGKPTNYICRKTKVVKGYTTRHSEVQAFGYLRKIKNRKLNNISIVNIRFSKEGLIKNSKCCLLCTKVLQNIGIKKIIYSTDEGYFVKEDIKSIIKTATLSKGSKLF